MVQYHSDRQAISLPFFINPPTLGLTTCSTGTGTVSPDRPCPLSNTINHQMSYIHVDTSTSLQVITTYLLHDNYNTQWLLKQNEFIYYVWVIVIYYKFLFTLAVFFFIFFFFLFQVQLLRHNDWFFYKRRIFQWHPSKSYAVMKRPIGDSVILKRGITVGTSQFFITNHDLIWWPCQKTTPKKKKTIAARQLHASTLVKNLKGAIYIDNAALSKNLLKKRMKGQINENHFQSNWD